LRDDGAAGLSRRGKQLLHALAMTKLSLAVFLKSGAVPVSFRHDELPVLLSLFPRLRKRRAIGAMKDEEKASFHARPSIDGARLERRRARSGRQTPVYRIARGSSAKAPA